MRKQNTVENDASTLARVAEAIERIRGTSAASLLQVETVAGLTDLLTLGQVRIRTAIEQSGESVGTLHESLRGLQSDANAIMAKLAQNLQHLHQQESSSRIELTSSQVEHQKLLEQVVRTSQEYLPLLQQKADEAHTAVEAVVASANSLTLELSAESNQLCLETERQRRALVELRENLGAQAQALQEESTRFSDSVEQHLVGLERAFENARNETKERVAELVSSALTTRNEASEQVQKRWAVDLAREVFDLAGELGRTLEELKEISRPVRQAADQEVLTSTQKLRETFDPLQKIEKVFRAARDLELC